MITVEAVAKLIISFRDDITNKKLQKLSYYVYAWYLTIYNDLIADIEFEAWEHGPVCRKIYNLYKRYGWNTIPRYEGFILVDDDVVKFVKSVLMYYGDMDAEELEELTHKEEPWLNARKGCDPRSWSNAVISKEDIIECYSKQIKIKEFILNNMATMDFR